MTLLDWACLIDNRLGPISGANADKMADAFREADTEIRLLRITLKRIAEQRADECPGDCMEDSFAHLKHIAREALGD